MDLRVYPTVMTIGRPSPRYALATGEKTHVVLMVNLAMIIK
jgi:hypothetical protein